MKEVKVLVRRGKPKGKGVREELEITGIKIK